MALWHEEDAVNILRAVETLLDQLGKEAVLSTPVTPRSKFAHSRQISQDLSELLRRHWKQPMVGPSLQMLRARIRDHEGQYDSTSNYSKSLSFVQSSGAGESRLADEFGDHCPMATYILREEGVGYPPADPSIYQLMQSFQDVEDKKCLMSPLLKLSSRTMISIYESMMNQSNPSQ